MANITLEVGKAYKSVSGVIYDVTEHTPGHRWDANFTAVSREDGMRAGFSDDGSYNPLDPNDPKNLIEEV